MSEYQYYEFVAIDQPLTPRQMAELRACSSRASITPTSFVNEYHWGGLKGDPDDWMRRYFDAHVYVTDMCVCCFMVRVPREIFDSATLNAFATESSIYIGRSESHWIISWNLNESENYDRFCEDDGRGWMGRLVALRDELLRGDLRSLYLGWLAGVTIGEVEEGESEPPPPQGLSRLTAAQQALLGFLEVDPDLVAATSNGDVGIDAESDDTDRQMDVWIAGLPADDSRQALKLLLSGQSNRAERQLKSRFLTWQKANSATRVTATVLRTVANLRELASSAEKVRRQWETEQRIKFKAEQQAQRDAYLRTLAADFDRCWQMLDKKAERGIASAYDEVSRAVVDLAEAYKLCSSGQEWKHAMQRFMERHIKRGALVRRLVEAGLWKKS
jgi:hypothetical protein